MRIGKVIGTVTLNRVHPTLAGAALRLTVPMTQADLLALSESKGLDPAEPRGEELVVYDDLGAGMGSLIAISEGGEAAQPFEPELKPVDAYNAAILDHIQV